MTSEAMLAGTSEIGHNVGGRSIRVLISGALLSAGVFVMVAQAQVRGFEAWATSELGRRLLGMSIHRVSTEPVILFSLPGHRPDLTVIGLLITPECTVALLLAPLLGVAGLMVLGRRFAIRTILLATVFTAAELTVVNLGRLLLIVGFTNRWGMSGFQWSHEVYGSLISILGVCLGAALFLKALIRRPGPLFARLGLN